MDNDLIMNKINDSIKEVFEVVNYGKFYVI